MFTTQEQHSSSYFTANITEHAQLSPGTHGGFLSFITLDKDSFGAMSQVKSFSAQTELMLQIIAAKKIKNPFLCPPLPEIDGILF